jgi:hypothetical protein
MNLQKRIQQSAAELGKLLRQAEKKHQRILKRRDAKMKSISPKAPWVPDGHLLVIPDHVPINIHFRGEYSHTVSKDDALFLLDNGKPFKPIGLRQDATRDENLNHDFLSALGIPEASSPETNTVRNERFPIQEMIELEPHILQMAQKLSSLLEAYLLKARKIRGIHSPDPREPVFNHLLDFDTKVCAMILSSRFSSIIPKHVEGIFKRLDTRY